MYDLINSIRYYFVIRKYKTIVFNLEKVTMDEYEKQKLLVLNASHNYFPNWKPKKSLNVSTNLPLELRIPSLKARVEKIGWVALALDPDEFALQLIQHSFHVTQVAAKMYTNLQTLERLLDEKIIRTALYHSVTTNTVLCTKILTFLSVDEQDLLATSLPWKKNVAQIRKNSRISSLWNSVQQVFLQKLWSYLPPRSIATSSAVCNTWNHNITKNNIVLLSIRSTPSFQHERYSTWMCYASRRAATDGKVLPRVLSPHEYKSLIANAPSDNKHHHNNNMRALRSDVTRAVFPSHALDNLINPEEGRNMLRRVLTAYIMSEQPNDRYYAQGMSFIASGLLVSVNFNEQHAFELFRVLMSVYDLFSTTTRFTQLEKILSQRMPKILVQFEALDIQPPMFAIGWFNTLFFYDNSVSSRTMNHFLDCFFFCGWKFTFQIILTMLEENMSTLYFTKSLPHAMYLLNHLPSMSSSFSSKGFVEAMKFDITNQECSSSSDIITPHRGVIASKECKTIDLQPEMIEEEVLYY